MAGRRKTTGIGRVGIVSLALVAVYWAVAAFVLIVDPFDVYSWGEPAMLDPADVTDHNKLLVAAVARNPRIDLIMIGSSTALRYSAADLQRDYGARFAYNLSYGGARPADRRAVMETIVQDSRAARIVVWLDWAYSLPAKAEVPAFPAYMYDGERFNDLRSVNEEGLKAALRVVRGGSLFPNVRGVLAKRNASDRTEYLGFQSRASRRLIATMVERYRPIVTRPQQRRCSDFPAFWNDLLPELRRWSGSGRKADIIIPAYSPSFYYTRGDPASGLNFFDQLTLRRCAVVNTRDLSGVRVIALDADPLLTGNLRNYKDPGHLLGAAPMQRSLQHMARGDFTLNASNVDGYLRRLREQVIRYVPPRTD